MYTLAVLVVSIAPALAFLLLILRMDRREPEPLGLVLRVTGLGALGGVVAAIGETLIGGAPLFHAAGLAGAAASAFIQIAPIEELCKLGVVLAFVWKNPSFNEENDGIVYAGASAIGFAVLENILYVAGFGIGTGILRAFSAIPLHVFTGVIGGYFLGLARFAPSPAKRTGFACAAFASAWLAHGLYDTFAMSGSAVGLLILPLIAGICALGIVALKTGRKLSLRRWEPAAVARAPAIQEVPAALSATTTPTASEARPGASPEAATETPVVQEAPRPATRPPRWMPVISRTLLIACALFWMFMVIYFVQPDSEGRLEAALGGVLITAIPAGLGILIEINYARRKRRAKPAAFKPSPSAPL